MSFQNSCQQQQIREGILQYVNTYSLQHGRIPGYRDICRAVNLKSLSTVSRYMHELTAEGLMPTAERVNAPVPCAPSPVRPRKGVQRFCLVLADGGRLFMDCELQPNGQLLFSGVLDAEELKGSVSRIVKAFPVGEED